MSPTMQILMVSCWNKGLGLYHSPCQVSGNDKVCPDALADSNMDSAHAQMSLRNIILETFSKINYISGLQIYHFYFVSEY